jgi:WD40 repeat protein
MTGETEPIVRLKVFVSYSREDVEFADQLVIALEDRGFEPILDRHAIDAAENWRETLGKLVLSSDAVVYILTEKSAASPICTWEVEEAARLAKRIIPVTPRATTATPPKVIADLNWIYFYPTSSIPGSGVYDGMRRLDQALRIDHTWLREQTRLSERAAEWTKEPTEDRLLRGRSLREAEEWLSRKPANAAVAAKVSEYIAASADAERDRERLAQTELAEREEALHKAEIAVKQVATAQSERAATSARLRILAFFSIVLGAALSAGAVYGLWLASDNAAKAERRRVEAESYAGQAITARGQAEDLKKQAQVQSDRAEQAGASAKKLLATNVADLANILVGEGRSPQAVLTALSGMPTAQAEESAQPGNSEGYTRLLNVLALAYSQSRLERAFTVTTPRSYLNDGVRDLAISPDGKLIAATDNQNAKLWTIGGKLVATCEGHTGKIRTLAFAPDGKSILTGSMDGTARVWNLSCQQQMLIKTEDGEVSAVAFADTGKLIATASRSGYVKIWLAADGTFSRQIPADDAPEETLKIFDKAGDALSMAFVPGFDELLVGYSNSIAIRWSENGEVLETYEAMKRDDSMPSGVNSVAFAKSELDFAMAGSSGGVDIPQSGSKTTTTKEGESVPVEGKSIRALVDSAAWDVAYSKDGEGILVGFQDGSARLWNRFGDFARIFSGHADAVLSVAFTPDGKRLVTGSADGTIRVELLASPILKDLGDPSWFMHNGEFLPGGKRVLLKGNTNRPEIWSTDGKMLVTLGDKNPYQMTLSGDGKMVLMDRGEGIERWSLTGQKIGGFKLDSGGIIDAMKSSAKDGSIVVGLSGSIVAIYSASGKKLMETKPIKDAPKLLAVAFSPQGDKVAASDEDGQGWVWTTKGELVASLSSRQTYKANDIKFSPAGDSVLIGYSNNVARLWGLDGHVLSVFSGHKAQVRSVAFSPDGKWVATASDDMTARLWTLDGQPLDIFWGHTDWVESVGFSPDGKKLLTSSAYGPVRIWPLNPMLFSTPADQVKLACARLEAMGVTKFTEEEGRRYRLPEGANLDPCAAAKTASLASGGSAP